MKVIAPGKVLLFGAYSVLEGTQALVVAIDRYAIADTSKRAPSSSREVRAAIGDALAPDLDLSSLHQDGEKLGLGSSAAALVATLGARAAERGEDLSDAAVRKTIFLDARRAHADAQGGGSGVDIAASTYGGALFYGMIPAHDPLIEKADLPADLALRVFWSGRSARTSELLAKVRSFGEKDRSAFVRCIDAIGECVTQARLACDTGDAPGLASAGRINAKALTDLGRLADAPIVPQAFADLALVAEREGGAFYPSGAGGGDVGVWLGSDPPSNDFLRQARARGMLPLDLGMDRAGVRTRKD
ncbi:MAG: mevalonate kinase [Polyangiaceae bacterium]